MEQSSICAENCSRLNKVERTVAEKTGENTAAHQAIEHRLDTLEESMKEQNGILVTLQKQADAIESMNGKIDDVADSIKGVVTRIDKIEHEPGERWKTVTLEVIKYIVTAAIGAGVGILIKGGL